MLFGNLVAAEMLPGCHHILDPACAATLCARIEPFLTGHADTAAG